MATTSSSGSSNKGYYLKGGVAVPTKGSSYSSGGSSSSSSTGGTGSYVAGKGFVTESGKVYPTSNPSYVPAGYTATSTGVGTTISSSGKVTQYSSSGDKTSYSGKAIVPGTGMTAQQLVNQTRTSATNKDTTYSQASSYTYSGLLNEKSSPVVTTNYTDKQKEDVNIQKQSSMANFVNRGVSMVNNNVRVITQQEYGNAPSAFRNTLTGTFVVGKPTKESSIGTFSSSLTSAPPRYEGNFIGAVGQVVTNLNPFSKNNTYGLIGTEGGGSFIKQTFYQPFEYVGGLEASKTINRSDTEYVGTIYGVGHGQISESMGGPLLKGQITKYEIGQRTNKALYEQVGLKYTGENINQLPLRLGESLTKDTVLNTKYSSQIISSTTPEQLVDINEAYNTELNTIYNTKLGNISSDINKAYSFQEQIGVPKSYGVISGIGKGIELGAMFNPIAFELSSIYNVQRYAQVGLNSDLSKEERISAGLRTVGGLAGVGMGMYGTLTKFELEQVKLSQDYLISKISKVPRFGEVYVGDKTVTKIFQTNVKTDAGSYAMKAFEKTKAFDKNFIKLGSVEQKIKVQGMWTGNVYSSSTKDILSAKGLIGPEYNKFTPSVGIQKSITVSKIDSVSGKTLLGKDFINTKLELFPKGLKFETTNFGGITKQVKGSKNEFLISKSGQLDSLNTKVNLKGNLLGGEITEFKGTNKAFIKNIYPNEPSAQIAGKSQVNLPYSFKVTTPIKYSTGEGFDYTKINSMRLKNPSNTILKIKYPTVGSTIEKAKGGFDNKFEIGKGLETKQVTNQALKVADFDLSTITKPTLKSEITKLTATSRTVSITNVGVASLVSPSLASGLKSVTLTNQIGKQSLSPYQTPALNYQFNQLSGVLSETTPRSSLATVPQYQSTSNLISFHSPSNVPSFTPGINIPFWLPELPQLKGFSIPNPRKRKYKAGEFRIAPSFTGIITGIRLKDSLKVSKEFGVSPTQFRGLAPTYKKGKSKPYFKFTSI